MSQYFGGGDRRKGGSWRGPHVCVLWRCCRAALSHAGGVSGRRGAERRSRHLPDCWNVNAVALIIGFCTHRLWGTSSNFPPLIVRPGPGPSIGLGYVYTSTHVSIKTVYNACVRVCACVCVVLDVWITVQLCVTGRRKIKASKCQIIKIWQILKILRDLSALKVGLFQIVRVLQ